MAKLSMSPDDDDTFYDVVADGFGDDVAQDAMYERLRRRGTAQAGR